MSDRVGRKVLKWFRLHVERIKGEQLTKRVLDSEFEGRRHKIQKAFKICPD